MPDEPQIYGPASGRTLPVATFLTLPSSKGQKPNFADPNERYPLVLFAHGALAHGVYEVRHAHNLASHGYIVAVVNYWDDRTAYPDNPNHHVSFLRPFLTKTVLDALLENDSFGAHIDADNIGITGHSFGGFTVPAVAGGLFQGNTATTSDERIKAGVIAAPWVGGIYNGNDDVQLFDYHKSPE